MAIFNLDKLNLTGKNFHKARRFCESKMHSTTNRSVSSSSFATLRENLESQINDHVFYFFLRDDIFITLCQQKLLLSLVTYIWKHFVVLQPGHLPEMFQPSFHH